MNAWYASVFTGLFSRFGPLPNEPHDPDLALYSGTCPAWHAPGFEVDGGGIGLTPADAEGACVGEAIERLFAYPLPSDQLVHARADAWPLDEPMIPCDRWVLFHSEQYAQVGFPFKPLTTATECAWVCCREAITGSAWWVPADMVYLHPSATPHHVAGGLSTGLTCSRDPTRLLLRGLQEVLERDAVCGAWWGRYALQEFTASRVLDRLDGNLTRLVSRANLHYCFYRVRSPYSDHVTIATLAGEDREGWCFSIGSACRETMTASWTKSLLEAIHSRHYVRFLQTRVRTGAMTMHEIPHSFSEHAVYYSIHPERLKHTALAQADRSQGEPVSSEVETLASLRQALGPQRPVLFRSLAPTPLLQDGLDWHVIKVLVPGLQPLHGHHGLACLGGPLWAPRGPAAWAQQMPHPFP